MHLLITGANGYIGQRLIPVLLEQGHTLYCCVRNRRRFEEEHAHERIHIVEVDLLHPEISQFPPQVEAAYYLVHSMSSQGEFMEQEQRCALHFLRLLQGTGCRQIIYLAGIVNADHLSHHLESRLAVENILRQGPCPLTVLRAGIIVGSGSASFEIIRDLVEKLPVMVAPRWLNTRCQPIAIRNVIQYLTGVLGLTETYNRTYDIGGPEILTYRQMLLQFADVRGLKRWILTLPVMTPRLSSYWLYFITSTTYPLAVNLVNSMKVDVICNPDARLLLPGQQLIPYRQAVQLAFQKIEQNMVLSSWKDAFIASETPPHLMQYVEVPRHGCFKDIKWRPVREHEEQVLRKIWSIGGETGWYYGNSLWRLRGWMDKFVGGVGLRRGRRSPVDIYPGDALDFWRVLVADKQEKRLLLFAEMKVPGEAWLEFKIMKKDHQPFLRQTATFRPRGLWGRLYWYCVLPFHYFIFNGMIDELSHTGEE